MVIRVQNIINENWKIIII